MKLAELFEKINEKIFYKGFEQKKAILDGKYELVAKAGYIKLGGKFKSDQFRIEAMQGKAMVGWVNFEKVDGKLEALDLSVEVKHRRQGIASEMYKFAKELGNDIAPSSKQTGMGKLFWSQKDHNKEPELAEAFNKKVDYDVTTHTASKYQLEATINGRKIRVTFAKIDSEPDGWDFDFMEQKKDGKWTSGKTGSGGEMEVFSFVKTALDEFIDVYHPETIEFNAFDEDDPKRGRIYQKMIKSWKLPYDMEVGHSMAGNQFTFTLKRKD